MRKFKLVLSTVCVMSLVVMVLAGCGSRNGDTSNSASTTGDAQTDTQVTETNIGETEDSKETDGAGEIVATEEMLSVADVAGVWELPDITPAGDPCVYQLRIGEDNSISFMQYLAQEGKWRRHFLYEGDIKCADMESEVMSEGRGDVILDEGFSGYTYVDLDMRCINENETFSDRIYGVNLIEKSADSIEIILIDGVSLMPDHFYEPVIFTQVTDVLEDGTDIGSKDNKGAYYDWFIEVSDAGWRDAYIEMITEIRIGNIDMSIPYYGVDPAENEYSYMNENLVGDSYYLYDIDKDEIPELIVKLGTCEADYWGLVFKYQDYQAQYFDGIGLGHSVLYSYPGQNGMIVQFAHMGSNSIERTFISERGMDFEGLYAELDIQTSEDYMDPGDVVSGAKALPYSDMNDSKLIFEYRNMDL